MPKNRMKRLDGIKGEILKVVKKGNLTTMTIKERLKTDVTWKTVRSYLSELEEEKKVIKKPIYDGSRIVVWSLI